MSRIARIEHISKEVCKRGKFGVSGGTCAAICMDQPNSVREMAGGCQHAYRIYHERIEGLLRNEEFSRKVLTVLGEADEYRTPSDVHARVNHLHREYVHYQTVRGSLNRLVDSKFATADRLLSDTYRISYAGKEILKILQEMEKGVP